MSRHLATTGAKADGGRRLEGRTGAGQRRRWTAEEKAWIVAESLDPATTAAAVARRYGLHTSQLVTWRQQLHRRASSPATIGEPAFVPVLLAEDDQAPAEAVGRMEVAPGPAVVRLGADVDAAALRRVLEVVRGLP